MKNFGLFAKTSQRRPHSQALVAALLVAALLLPRAAFPVGPPLGVTPVLAGSAEIGGVRICVPQDATIPSGVVYSDGVLSALYAGSPKVDVPMDASEFVELAYIAKHAVRGCIEVSIDPISDGASTYWSDEMLLAPKISKQLLALDWSLASFFAGLTKASAELVRGVPMPAAETRRLLDPQQGDASFAAAALNYVTPAIFGHTTEISLDPAGAATGEEQLTVRVRPRVHFTSADGLMLQPLPGEDRVLSLPYQPLVDRFRSDPRAFREVVPGLSDGLRYARAISMLSRCAADVRGNCEIRQPSSLSSTEPKPDPQSRVTRTRELQAWVEYLRAIKYRSDTMTAAWRRHRLAQPVASLSEDQRVSMFIAESLRWYRDMQSMQQLRDQGSSSTDPLRALLAGLDVSRSPYAGYIELGRFLIDTWDGRPLQETTQSLNRAYAQAMRTQDSQLRYQIFRAIERLLPVMRSNAEIAAGMGPSTGSIQPEFAPWDGLGQGPLSVDRYLSYLSVKTGTAIAQHMTEEYARIDTQVASLYGADGLTSANSQNALKVLMEFQSSHLLDERHRLRDDPFNHLARLHFAAGQALARERNFAAARNHARLLDSLARLDSSDLNASAVLRYRGWAEQIRELAPL